MSNYVIGLSGLQNTSLAIDNTSNNIANANTVGYKAGDYVFADQFLRTMNPADSGRIGMGSERMAVRRPLTEGGITNSTNPLDMAITGDGWFRLLSNPTDPTSLNYTRNGQFAVDQNGWIVNENGMYLTGYQPSADGSTITDDVRGLGTTSGKLRMPADYANGSQTTTATISAVLDSRENAFVYSNGVAFDPAQNTYNSKTTQTIYDSNGTAHTLDVYYRRVSDTSLTINMDSNGYNYSPGNASVPNTLSDTHVLIPVTSALRVQSAPLTTVLGPVDGQSLPSGDSTIALGSGKVAAADIPVGSKIFMNGRDTGLTVRTAVTKGNPLTSLAAAGSPAVDIPASAAFTFYPADILDTASAPAGLTDSTFTLTTGSNALVGRRLFIGTEDTGLTVTNYDPATRAVTLSGKLPSALVSTDPVTFKNTLDMTLTAPDGTNIVVKGTTNRVPTDLSTNILTALEAKVEVYTAIDTKFYSQGSDTTSVSNKAQSPETPSVGGYQTAATIGFIGGRNIDSLIADSSSGKPMFSTVATLSTRVVNGLNQNTTIPLIFNLDLSGTQIQSSSFQVNQSSQDGEPRSQLASITIDNSGMIVGVYGNGRKVVAGQIALAHFDASEQLVPSGGNAFAPSYLSGTEGDAGVRIGRAGEGSFGSIRSQALEQSNVDLSNELVKLMLLQRTYSANSQSLRAFDQTMQDTIRMLG